MTTILAFAAGYFALLMVLSIIARPSRLRIAELARELAQDDLKPRQRQHLKVLLDSSYSMRSAPVHLAAIVIALLTPSEKFDAGAREWAKDNQELIEDPRWNELFERHIVSIVAVNPIFGALLSVARLLFRLKAYLFAKRLRGAVHIVNAQPVMSPKALEMYGEFRPVTT